MIRGILTQIFQRCMPRDVGLLAGNVCRLAAVEAHSLQHGTFLWSNPKWKHACESMLQSESGAGGCGIFTAWRCPGFPSTLCSEPLMVNAVCMCVCEEGLLWSWRIRVCPPQTSYYKKKQCGAWATSVLSSQHSPKKNYWSICSFAMTHGGLPQEWPTFEPCHIPWDPDGTLLGNMK